FSVKACNDAHIALSSNPGFTAEHTYEIVLGGASNKKSFIRNETLSASLVSKDTPGILSCDEYREFWISWEHDMIEVGTGTDTGRDMFMNYAGTSLFPIHGLAVSTGWGAEGDWELNLKITFETVDSYTYTQNWVSVVDQDHIVMKVQACADAHIIFSETEDEISDNVYEVIIGGWDNTKSAIRDSADSADIATEAFTPNITDCQEKRPFWISWEDGMLRAGEGNIRDEKVLLEWRDPEPLSIGLGSISTGFGSEGIWQFD
ncbi:hypothetical protein CAPTEDRAFT_63764, partial [Capitella teleta]